MMKEAPSAEQVFENFYNWAFTDIVTLPDFLVWGSTDNKFIQHTCKKIQNFKARMALGYISGSIENYAKTCKKYLRWDSDRGLLKTFQKIHPEATQDHNSLNDAIMLKQIYDFMNTTPLTELLNVFQDWRKKPNEQKSSVVKEIITPDKLPKGSIYMYSKRGKKRRVTYFFANIKEAADWIYQNKYTQQDRKNFNQQSVEKKILKVSQCGGLYYNIKWGIA